MFDVYCHINKLDQKRYVGFSHHGIEARWQGHLASTRKRSKHYFHRAIRLHGEESFEHVLLEQCETVEAAREIEIWWIGHFCSDDSRFGYNMTSGGEGCPNLTEEARKRKSEKIKAWFEAHPERKAEISAKCAETNRKRVHSDETRGKFSKLHRGRKMSEEQKEKIGKANSGKVRSPEIRKKISEATKLAMTPEVCQKISDSRQKQLEEDDHEKIEYRDS